MKQFSKISILIFIGLTLFFIPVTWNLFPYHGEFTSIVFSAIINQIAYSTNIEIILSDFSSDSKGLYVLISVLFIFSILTTPLIIKIFTSSQLQKFEFFLKIISTYYLSVILMKYGFDKVFKAQFYLPEPNILYTPLGKLDKDILFWSTMGVSRSYNLFLGFAEIIPAILILFYRTRQIGLMISLGVLINVLAINLSFDISVKLFSAFLILINLYLLIPTLGILWNLFILNKVIRLKNQFNFSIPKSTKIIIKTIVICLLLLESLFTYLNSGNFNDDISKRPFLHGAYVVKEFNQNGIILNTSNSPFKRIFIHRDGYLILQNQQDEMTDYKLEINQVKQTFLLTDYQLNRIEMHYLFSKKDSLLGISFKSNGVISTIKSKMLNWKKLPVLKSQFHWTVD
jgi:hypothetical protein